MNKTAWNMILALGSAVAVASACTVSSGGGNDDDDGTTDRGSPVGGSTTSGSGGTGGDDSTTTSSTTGSTSGGAAGEPGTGGSGGSGGTGGSGGAEIECLEEGDPMGEPAETEGLDQDANTCCTLCAAERCADEMGACYALNPENVCGAEGGEMEVLQNCMLDLEGLPGTGDDSDLLGCAAEAVNDASGPLCGLDTISGTTNELASCIHGDEDGLGGCFEECFNPDFDDDSCLYRD